jgi:YD repeat-containing protein
MNTPSHPFRPGKVWLFITAFLLGTTLQLFAQQPSDTTDYSKFPRLVIPKKKDTVGKAGKKTMTMSSGILNEAPGHPGAAEATLPVVVLPAPNSAVLTRLVSENVDLYTGRLNIDIPVYTLKSHSIEVPVSLQGNVNSHKVNEIASWVGMGWSLNAGGSITRVMKNMPDEFSGTINSTYFNILGYGYTRLKSQVDVDISLFESGSYNVTKQREIIDRGNWNVGHDLPSSGYDLQPDEFYFSFGKYSGKFVFDQDGSIYTIPKSNLKFTPAYQVVNGNNKIISFIATTDDGYQYEFGNFSLNAVEETRLSTTTRSIRYFYEAVMNAFGFPEQDGLGRYRYFRQPDVFTRLEPPAVASDGSMTYDNFDRNIETVDYMYYPSTWHLTKIVSPTNDYVNFNYTSNGTISYLADRSFSASILDLEEEVGTISTPQTTTSFLSLVQPIQVAPWWPLHYPTPHIFTVTESNVSLTSKRLQSITTPQNYNISFEANTARLDFPGDKRLDRIVIKDNNTVIKEFELNYENRSSDEALENFKFTFYGMIYLYNNPGNTYSGTGAAVIQESRTFPVPDYCRKRMFLTTVQEKGTGVQIPPYTFNYNTTALPFRTSTEQDYFGFANNNPSRHPFTSLNYSYPIANNQTKTIPSQNYWPVLYFQVTNGGANNLWPSTSHTGTKNPALDKLKAGVLTKITYPTGGYKEYDFEFNGNAAAWNGVRAKTVKEYASPAATPVTKEYAYGDFKPTDGVVIKHQMIENSPAAGYNDFRVFWSSERANPENLTRGTAGGYNYAEVSQPGNGKYRIEFSNNSISGYDDQATMVKRVSALVSPNIQNISEYIAPFPQSTNVDWKRGLPLAETYTDALNNKIKTVSYEYDFTTFNSPEKTIDGMAVTKIRYNFDNGGWNWFLYGKYSYPIQWFNLSSKTEKNYAKDGVHFKEIKEDYTYKKQTIPEQDLVYSDQVKSYNNSKNEQLVTKQKHPLDYVATTDAFGLGIAHLKTKNIFSAIVEKYQYLQDQNGNNKRYVAGMLNKYHSNKPLLQQVYELQPSGSLGSFAESVITGTSFVYDAKYSPAQTFSDYDTYGNILEQTENPDITEAYKWGYNSTIPVVKATNAKSNEVFFDGFEEIGSWNAVAYDNTKTHSGRLSGLIDKPTAGEVYYHSFNWLTVSLTANKKFKLSGWVFSNGPSVQLWLCARRSGETGFSYFWDVQTTETNKWVLVEREVDVPADVAEMNVRIDNNGGGKVWFDDMRLHPADAQVTTFTFRPLVGMTSQSDPNNRTVYYEYDGLQRLSAIKDEAGNITKTIQYNYASGSTAPVWMASNDRRCKPCGQTAYTTNIQQAKYVDVNPSSSSYGAVDWKDIGDNGACSLQPDWVAISSPTCKLDQNGLRTGILEHIEKDMHSCTPTSNTTRVVQVINHSVCPPNAPDWQPTAVYRCQPCAANGAYTNAVQERKYIDMNPNSATYNSVSWQATGGSCVVNADWQFTATAERCAVYNGLPTGFLEREQKDMNPCSPTYNTLRWETTGQSSACNVVYKYLSFENPYYGYQTTVDVVVYLYLDPSYSVPADNVSSHPVTIMDQYSSSCNPMYTFPRYFYVNGPYMTVISGTVYGEWDEGGGCYGYKDYYFGN